MYSFQKTPLNVEHKIKVNRLLPRTVGFYVTRTAANFYAAHDFEERFLVPQEQQRMNIGLAPNTCR